MNIYYVIGRNCQKYIILEIFITSVRSTVYSESIVSELKCFMPDRESYFSFYYIGTTVHPKPWPFWRTFLPIFRTFLNILTFSRTLWMGGVIYQPSQGLYLHRTTQHRKMRTYIHASSGIQTHDPNVQVAKTYTLDHAAAVIGSYFSYST
jgi:hypothetical protein